jgi:hypothetical protein
MPASSMKVLAARAAVALPLALAFVPAIAAGHGEGECAALANLALPNTNLLSASLVPAAGDLPEYCRVLGYVRPAINFEVRLPTRDWNGKFYMAGCGGFCGSVEADRPRFTNAMNHGLRRNYAVSTTDAGHWGGSVVDGRWAWNNRLAEIDWGYRAVNETARVSKATIKAFYGRNQSRAYFAGCSTGGRMANMEASRFPEDFDGIISGAPALDYPGLVATLFAWVVQANTGPDGKPVLSPTKVGRISEAVYEACDGKDGLKDGLIDDPRACRFEPSTLICKNGAGEDCLSAAEAQVLTKWYAGPTNSKGEQLFPGGIPPGSEPFWGVWLTGNPVTKAPAVVPLFGRDFKRYMAFADDPGERYNAADFDFDVDPARLAEMSAIYNSDNPDLSRFRDRGGKLLMYHGWADAVVTPYKTIEYVEAVEKTLGGRERTRDFLRLFMVPGFDHCGIQAGPGPIDTGTDMLTALENWVEKGEAPDRILMTRSDDKGQAQWSRPLCPYPQLAKLRGGDQNDAANFECVEP